MFLIKRENSPNLRLKKKRIPKITKRKIIFFRKRAENDIITMDTNKKRLKKFSR